MQRMLPSAAEDYRRSAEATKHKVGKNCVKFMMSSAYTLVTFGDVGVNMSIVVSSIELSCKGVEQ